MQRVPDCLNAGLYHRLLMTPRIGLTLNFTHPYSPKLDDEEFQKQLWMNNFIHPKPCKRRSNVQTQSSVRGLKRTHDSPADVMILAQAKLQIQTTKPKLRILHEAEKFTVNLTTRAANPNYKDPKPHITTHSIHQKPPRTTPRTTTENNLTNPLTTTHLKPNRTPEAYSWTQSYLKARIGTPHREHIDQSI